MMKKITSFILGIGMTLMTSGILSPMTVTAVSIIDASAEFGRLKEGITADYAIIKFNTPSGIQTGGADTISLTFSSDFTLATESITNFDVGLGNTTCSSATFSDETVAATATVTDWGVDVAGNVVTFSPATSDSLTAGNCIMFEIGTAATTGGTGLTNTITNGPADDDDTISIAGGFGDTGTITVDIIDDDQVTVTASVNQSLAFDLDTSVTDVETDDPYTVPLGILNTADVRVSGATDNINMIITEGWTNASGGMNVTVRNANGAQGLKSASTPTDYISSTTATMAAGTANYGLCVASTGLTGFTRSSTYSTTCALNSENNAVVALTTTPTDLVGSTIPVNDAHAEVVVNAAISSGTASHADYIDTLTFIATASY